MTIILYAFDMKKIDPRFTQKIKKTKNSELHYATYDGQIVFDTHFIKINDPKSNFSILKHTEEGSTQLRLIEENEIKLKTKKEEFLKLYKNEDYKNTYMLRTDIALQVDKKLKDTVPMCSIFLGGGGVKKGEIIEIKKIKS